jgi:hypothetical protein
MPQVMITNFTIMFNAEKINATKSKNLAGKQKLKQTTNNRTSYFTSSFTSIFSKFILAGPVTTKPFVLYRAP